LDGKGADAAGAAVDEHAVAFGDASDHAQIGPHRARHLDHAGGLLNRQALWDGCELTLRHCDILGVAAAGEQAADLLTFLAASRARVCDDSRAFQPHNFGLALRRRVLPGGLHQIAAVHAGGNHLD